MMENSINSMVQIEKYLGDETENLLSYKTRCISKDRLTLPGPSVIETVFGISDRNVQVLKSLSSIYQHGRLAGTGYLSILPVDQGIEHPIDLCRYQVANCYMGKIGLINSGGASSGADDFPHGCDQQTCRRHRIDIRQESVSTPNERGGQVIKPDSGCLPA